MKISYNNKNREEQEIEKDYITIHLTEDIDFIISLNNFGDMVIQKENYRAGERAIIIKPNVSNEIRLS